MSADFFGRTAPESPRERGFDRRELVKTVTLAAASIGLSACAALKIAEAAAAGLKPSVIWLHFQECTGCTESLLRTSHPALAAPNMRDEPAGRWFMEFAFKIAYSPSLGTD